MYYIRNFGPTYEQILSTCFFSKTWCIFNYLRNFFRFQHYMLEVKSEKDKYFAKNKEGDSNLKYTIFWLVSENKRGKIRKTVYFEEALLNLGS